jgi:hypothetical protein
VSYACFEGCRVEDPSVSSVVESMCYANRPGYTYCIDHGCDGAVEVCYVGGRAVRMTSL